MEKEILVCSECGSAESIQIKVWNYVNSNECAGECSGEREDNWCEDCEEHVDFVTKEEYKNQK